MCFQGELGCSCFIGQVMAVLTCCSYTTVCEIQSALKQALWRCFTLIKTKKGSLVFIETVFTNNSADSNSAATTSVRLHLPCLILSVISSTFTWLKASLTNHRSKTRVHHLHKPLSMKANTVAYSMWMSVLELHGCFFILVLGGECVRRSALWQAEAESNTVK